jgi:hypothetical protein
MLKKAGVIFFDFVKTENRPDRFKEYPFNCFRRPVFRQALLLIKHVLIVLSNF